MPLFFSVLSPLNSSRRYIVNLEPQVIARDETGDAPSPMSQHCHRCSNYFINLSFVERNARRLNITASSHTHRPTPKTPSSTFQNPDIYSSKYFPPGLHNAEKFCEQQSLQEVREIPEYPLYREDQSPKRDAANSAHPWVPSDNQPPASSNNMWSLQSKNHLQM